MAGCSFSSPADHGSAPDATAGSDAGNPVDAVPDSTPIDASQLDSDGDGILDSTDNCDLVANPAQHDKDSDGMGDECDPCPHLAGTDADADGDGVGDACDPDPAAPNHRVLFDGFYADTGLAAWIEFSIEASSPWSVSDGGAWITDATKLGALFSRAPALVGGVLTAQFTPTQIGVPRQIDATTVYPSIGLLLGVSNFFSADRTAYTCSLADGPQRAVQATAEFQRSGVLATTTAWPQVFAVNTPYVLTEDLTQINRCRVSTASSSVVATRDASTQPTDLTGIAGVSITQMAGRVDYVFLVSRALPGP